MPSSPRAWSRLAEARDGVRGLLMVFWGLALCAPTAGAREQDAGVSASNADEAESAPTILLIRTPGDDGVMSLLRLELTATKWAIVELSLDERRGMLPLAAIAEQQRASAAVRVDRERGRIELWVQQEGGAVSEVLAAENRGFDDRVLALRATEALRARGLDLDPVTATDGGAGEAEPVAADAAERGTAVVAADAPATPDAAPARPSDRSQAAGESTPSRRVWLGAGPGAVWSPGGVGSQLVGSLELNAEVRSRISVSALGLLPLSSGNASGVEGTAEVQSWLFGARASYRLFESGWLALAPGLGLLGAVVDMQGEAAPGYRAVGDRVTALVPMLSMQIGARLSRAWGLTLGGFAGASAPEVKVVFDEREVARWGRPLVGLSAAVEVSLATVAGAP